MPMKVPSFRARSLGPPAARPDQRAYNHTAMRRESRDFYTGAPWRRLRLAYLAEHPLCEWCSTPASPTAATTVHHVIERRERPDLGLDWDNLKSSCSSCHSRFHAEKKGKK